MPRKIRQLIADLEMAGFTNMGGKGSHRNFKKEGYPSVTISGKLGADAKLYQEREIQKAIKNEH
jgi:predicted RNA binding protein YcfA (HicA-like mRNA interferase family)